MAISLEHFAQKLGNKPIGSLETVTLGYILLRIKMSRIYFNGRAQANKLCMLIVNQ